jgi:hypothetical protein
VNQTLHGWIGTPTWDESRAYLSAHAGVLLTDSIEAELAALVATDPSAGVLALHLELLRAARAGGVEAPYRALAAAAREHALAELLVAWVGTQTWEEAHAFVDEHEASLLTHEAEAGLARLAADNPDQPDVLVHQGLLTLCRLDGVDKAYGLLDDLDRLRRLATSPKLRDEPVRLVALGRLLAGLFPDDASAQVTMAISALRVDSRVEAEQAVLRAARVSGGGVVASQLSEVAEREPDLAPALFGLRALLG